MSENEWQPGDIIELLPNWVMHGKDGVVENNKYYVFEKDDTDPKYIYIHNQVGRHIRRAFKSVPKVREKKL